MAKHNKSHIRALAAPFLAVTLLFVAASTASSGDVAQVKNIELIYNDGGVIVRVHTGAMNEFTHQIEPAKNGKPYRVILDCLDADHSLGGNTFNTLPASVIDNIRTSQFTVSPRHICRVVLDLKKEAFYRVNQSDKYIDLYVTDRDAKRFGPWSTVSWLASQEQSNTTAQPKSNPNTVASKPTESQQQSASAQKSVAVSTSTPKSEKAQTKTSTDLTLTQDQLDAALSAIQPQESLTQNPETKTQTASDQKSAEKAPAVSASATTVAKQVEQPKQAAVENPQKVSKPVESKTVATQKPVVTAEAKFDSKATDKSASTTAQPKPATSGSLAEAAATKTITQPATSKPSAQSVEQSKTVTAKPVTDKPEATKLPVVKSEVATSPVKSQDASATKTQSVDSNQKTASKQVTNEKQNPTPAANTVAQQPVSKSTAQPAQKSNTVLDGKSTSNAKNDVTANTSKPAVSAKSVAGESAKPSQNAVSTKSEKSVPPVAKPVAETKTVAEPVKTATAKKESVTPETETNSVEPKKSGSSLFASSAQAADEDQAETQTEADDSRGYSATFRRAVRDKEEIKLKGTQVAEFPKRLTIQYKSQGDRDPFKSLFIEEKRDSNDPLHPSLPNVEYLTMVGVLRDVNGGMRGLFEDIDGRGYILSAGDKVKNGTVLKITSDNAYFQIFEYGWSRTAKLELDGQ